MLYKTLAANDVRLANSFDLQLFNDDYEEPIEPIEPIEPTEPLEPTEPVIDEPTEPIEPVVADVTQTQAFSRRLNEERARIAQEAEIRAVDNYIAKQYEGQLWNGKPITTKAELDQALYEKQLIDAGQDPDTVKKLIDEHPDVVSSRTSKRNMEQWSELVADHPDITDATQVPGEAWLLYRDKGVPLLDAYNRVLIKNQKAQIDKVKLETEQETIRKLNKNATSSPGSASNGGVVHKTKSVEDMTAEEFEAYREEVRKQRRDD